jgi:hypothetical protein
VITVELVGGPADGARFAQIDFRHSLPIPPAFGPQNGSYRLRAGQIAEHPSGVAVLFANRVLLYDYQPPERTGA